MSKQYRYHWAAMDEPSRLSDKDLISKYDFYKFILKWTPEEERNELYDRLSDLSDEIEDHGLIKKN